MTTSTEAGGESFSDLPLEEQRARADEAFERTRPAWERRSDVEKAEAFQALRRAQEATPADAEGLSETERKMRKGLDQTYEVELFAHDDDVPTIPFELRRLPEELRDVTIEVAEFMHAAEGAADEEELDELVVQTSFGSAAALEAWLWEFLEHITVDEAFDAERWETGRDLIEGTRMQILLEIYLRHQEEIERVQEFRTEQ